MITSCFWAKGVYVMAALIKCPNCGSTRLVLVKTATGLAGKMGMKIYVCQNCGKESKIKDKR